MLGRVASYMVIPGRVGLVAVDALALGLPVVTTDFPHHAPEVEYLTGEALVSTRRSARELAAAMIAFHSDPMQLQRASNAADGLGKELTIEVTAAAFAGPLLGALQQPAPWHTVASDQRNHRVETYPNGLRLPMGTADASAVKHRTQSLLLERRRPLLLPLVGSAAAHPGRPSDVAAPRIVISPATRRGIASLVLLLFAFVAAAANNLPWTGVLLLLSLLATLDGLSTKRGHPWHSPPRFLGATLAAAGLLGWFAASTNRTASGRTLTSAILVIDDGTRVRTLCLFLAVSAAAYLAAVIRPFRVSAGPSRRLTSAPSWLLAAGACPLVLMAVGMSPAYIWRSPGYLTAAGPAVAVKIGTALAIPGIAAVAASMLVRKQKALGAIGILLYTAIAFARGSRLLALVPILVLGTWLLTTDCSRRKRLFVAIPTVFVALVALELPLTLRGLPRGGIAPYAGYLLTHSSALSLDVRPQLSNLLFGFNLAGFVGEREGHLPLHDLAVSLSPLPGGASGWVTLSRYLRVNSATPFSGLGELYNYGWIVATSYVFLTALFLGEVRTQLDRRIKAGLLAGLLVTALTAIVALNLLQYNLRAGTRILYFTFVILCAAVVLRKRVTGRQVQG